MNSRPSWFVLICVFFPSLVVGQDPGSTSKPELTWEFGLAKTNITPDVPLLMSGYASRETPAIGKLTDLWAKVLVLKDCDGNHAVLVTVDLIGIGKDFYERFAREIRERYGIDKSEFSICCSHTHTGPAIAGNLRPMYAGIATAEALRQIDVYSEEVENKILDAVGEAIGDLKLGTLHWGSGKATFATNRRENDERRVPALRVDGELVGPFDHDVPVLAIKDTGKKLRAVVFGYACHATVLSDFRWSGDYPGFAQLNLEANHDGCLAMFWAGCGADQNPLPRRDVRLARHYGRRLAVAVEEVLLTHELIPVESHVSTRHKEIPLGYASLPTKEQLTRDASSTDKFVAARARLLQQELDTKGAIADYYKYPLVAWRLGQIDWIFMGGEVVVDYALQLKGLGSSKRTWVTAYANDVMAYIPSERVLREGRYEGAGAMVYYGLPSPWASGLEAKITNTVEKMRKSTKQQSARQALD